MAESTPTATEQAAPAPPPRLYLKYRDELRSKIGEELGITNVHAVPRLKKIVVNMGVGEAAKHKAKLEHAARDLGIVTGQKPIITIARKSVASFHLRDGMPIGCKVTLRGKRMWEFYDRLVSVAIPRIRDFRGMKANAFDGRGNYSLGLSEQILFPEINIDSVQDDQGMDVTIVTSSPTNEGARALLKALGFPFERPEEKRR
jgi:large subunit ribosomal protein L5